MTEKALILLGLFFVVALNEDSAVVSGAVLSYHQVFPAWQPFVACFLGMWTSDFALYALSRFGGQRLLGSRWVRRFISSEQVQRASIVFEKYGGLATVLSRFALGTRTALLVASGLLRYPAHKFLTVTFIGAIGWLLLVYSLFDFFGLAATAIFGLRWITAFAMVLFGGTAAVLVAARSRKQRPISITEQNGDRQ
ncbi:MAG: DedA family protein [Verrucomicrobia bacterium]|nr:DedA family protein [Verrucomicrobiota bacterium]